MHTIDTLLNHSCLSPDNFFQVRIFISLISQSIKWAFIRYQNVSINVHERVDIFAQIRQDIEKNVTNRQEQLDVFSCGDNSYRIIAVVDLIFLQVVL